MSETPEPFKALYNRLMLRIINVSDSLSLSDTAVRDKKLIYATDYIETSDFVEGNVSVSVVDSLAISDVALSDRAVELSDSLEFTDTLWVDKPLSQFKEITDSLSLSDVVSVGVISYKYHEVFDSLALSDETIITYYGILMTVSDSMLMTDVVKAYVPSIYERWTFALKVGDVIIPLGWQKVTREV